MKITERILKKLAKHASEDFLSGLSGLPLMDKETYEISAYYVSWDFQGYDISFENYQKIYNYYLLENEKTN